MSCIFWGVARWLPALGRLVDNFLRILGEAEDGVVEGNSQISDSVFVDATVAGPDGDNGWKSKRRKAEERMHVTGGSLEDDEIEEF